MELENQTKYLPLQMATKYYKSWDCQTQVNVQNNIYYKSLHGTASIDLANGNRYEGTLQNGLFHGKGCYQWKSGLVYEGDFCQNSITGQGTFKWVNGSMYKGQVKNGYRHGVGTFTSTDDGAEYMGDWVMGKYEGQGKIFYENKGYYVGQFLNNKKHGKGSMTYPSKNQYDGNWVQDKKQGKGVMNWYKQNEKYEGEWVNNLPQGYGQYYWYENKTQYKILKTIYKGNWVKGKRQGFGVFFYSNGCRFEGYFKNSSKEGYGITVDCYGVQKLDLYKDDRLVSLLTKQISSAKVSKKRKTKERQKTDNDKLPKLTKKNKYSYESQNPSEKEITLNSSQSPVDNEYKYYLDFEHPEINQHFYNFLLRENSQLRFIYKQLCSLSTQIKDFYSGLTLENYWKVIKDLKILNENSSLCLLNRQFAKGEKHQFELGMPNQKVIKILSASPEHFKDFKYKEVQWQQFVNNLNKTNFDWNAFSLEGDKTPIYVHEKINQIHNPLKIILYRHFICLLVRTAIIFEEEGTCLRKRTQFIINQLQLYTENTSKPERSALHLDYQTQNTKSIFVPDWAKPLNEKVIREVNRDKIQLHGKLDETIAARTMYTILEANHVLKDNTEKMMFLQKIERYLSIKTPLLKRDMKHNFQVYESLVKRNPYFNHVMNYEMLQKQVSQILYQAISRKIVCSSQEDLMQKYEQFINKLVGYIHENEEKRERKVKMVRKVIRTKKDHEKQELIRKTQEEKIRLEEQKRKREEEERQERQNWKMSLQDQDIIDYFEESEQSEEYLF